MLRETDFINYQLIEAMEDMMLLEAAVVVPVFEILAVLSGRMEGVIHDGQD